MLQSMDFSQSSYIFGILYVNDKTNNFYKIARRSKNSNVNISGNESSNEAEILPYVLYHEFQWQRIQYSLKKRPICFRELEWPKLTQPKRCAFPIAYAKAAITNVHTVAARANGHYGQCPHRKINEKKKLCN